MMMAFAFLLSVFAAGVALVLVTPFFASVMLAKPLKPRASTPGTPDNWEGIGPITVLVPAHDEGSHLLPTLNDIQQQLRSQDRLVVVADNCSDNTADIARAAGAQVVERHDLTLRGKSYALDFGVAHLRHNPPQAVIICDADCRIAPGALAHLATTALCTGRPTQALYLMQRPADVPSAKLEIAEFAWRVKNLVRPLGMQRMGLPCQLQGSGMAFPWAVIDRMRLASGQLAEDLELGIELAVAGTPALFCPQALVTSEFPQAQAGAQSQRTRWEHGHLAAILRHAPRLVLLSLQRLSPMLLAIAAELCVPPLALLSLLLIICLAITGTIAASGGSWIPAAFTLLATAMLTLSVVQAWRAHAREVISLRTFASIPMYVLAKVPMYLRFLVRRQMEWVRSQRGPQ